MYINFSFAEQVGIGDAILVASNAGLTPTNVLKISHLSLQGKYVVISIMFS